MSVLTEAGALLPLGIQLMWLFSENKPDFSKLTDIFGDLFTDVPRPSQFFRVEVTSELLVVDI
jgi:hypothetical protein